RVPRPSAEQRGLMPGPGARTAAGEVRSEGPPLLVVVGPTAVGKSECAVLACERFGGEIISVDSMQVYRGLDRGTAKPGTGERRGMVFLHRLLGRVDRDAAARLGPGDRQRLVRALEVFFAARRGLSDLIRDSPFGRDRFASVKIGLNMDREALYRIIDARVE